MRILRFIVFMSKVFAVFLIISAFLYIDFSGHKDFTYGVSIDARSVGQVKVDRYVTEEKIVYKSKEKYLCMLDYPLVKSKLFLNKKDFGFRKFVREEYGVKGQKCLFFYAKDGEKSDFLFLKHPEVITLKETRTDKEEMFFSPNDIISYMPIMEQYNFWKRGAQIFNVIFPVNEAIPPLNDKITVQYVDEEYIPIMGQRVEAESFLVRSSILPEVKLFLSKYMHKILALEIKKYNMRFVLVNYMENPAERLSFLVDNILLYLNLKEDEDKESLSEEERFLKRLDFSEKEIAGAFQDKILAQKSREELKSGDGEKGKEVFFESKSLMLSGKLSLPAGLGPFPAVLIVPRDGPETRSEQYLCEALSKMLSGANFAVLLFDRPGQGKSQGNFTDFNDEKWIGTIKDAAGYLNELTCVKKGSVIFIGHEGGGYLALKAASELSYVQACIVLGSPPGLRRNSLSSENVKEEVKFLLSWHGEPSISDELIEETAEKIKKYRLESGKTTEEFSFLNGIEVPLKAYRQFMLRNPYKEIFLFNKPLLVIAGKDDKYFDITIIDNIKTEDKNGLVKAVVFKNLSVYTEKTGFEINKDVSELIVSWLGQNISNQG